MDLSKRIKEREVERVVVVVVVPDLPGPQALDQLGLVGSGLYGSPMVFLNGLLGLFELAAVVRK